MKKQVKKNPIVKAVQKDKPVEYHIEDNIEVPLARSAITATPEYKVVDMLKVNQSVSYPVSKITTFDYVRNIFHKKTDKRFITRVVDKYTSRIFRIADGTMLQKRREK